MKTQTNQSNETRADKWLPITEDRAWKLCYPQAAPYAGYIVQTKTANIRCIRDSEGHKFAAMYLSATSD